MQHNMQAMYAHNSFGWNERDKRDEMAISDTFFLIARNSEVGSTGGLLRSLTQSGQAGGVYELPIRF